MSTLLTFLLIAHAQEIELDDEEETFEFDVEVRTAPVREHKPLPPEPTGEWVHLVCHGMVVVDTSRLMTTSTDAKGADGDSVSRTLVPTTEQHAVRREIRFNEARREFEYSGDTKYPTNDVGWTAASEVVFDHTQIRASFSWYTKPLLSKVLVEHRDAAALDRINGTWTTEHFSIPCSVVTAETRKF